MIACNMKESTAPISAFFWGGKEIASEIKLQSTVLHCICMEKFWYGERGMVFWGYLPWEGAGSFSGANASHLQDGSAAGQGQAYKQQW